MASSQEKKEESSSAAELRAEARQAGDAASQHAKESAAEYKQQAHKSGLSALKGAQEQYQSAKETAVQEKDRLLDCAADTKNSAADTVHGYVEAGKQKLGDVGEATKQTDEQSKQTAAETAENVKQTTPEKYNQTVQNAHDSAQNAKDQTANTFNEASESAGQAAHEAKSDSQNMYGAVKDNTYDYIEEAKRNLFHGEGDGGARDHGPGDGAARAKQKAAQVLGSVQNETADTFGETEDRKTLSESTAGYTDPKESGTRDGDATRDATADKTTSREYYSENPAGISSLSDVKQKASQFLGSAQNETADTLNDSTDRATLSQSTANATKPKTEEAPTTWDTTEDKTKAPEYYKPGLGGGAVIWAELKLKASQILESFGNEMADTFDTVQDRKSISESTAGSSSITTEEHGAEEAAAPFDHTDVKPSVHEKVREVQASLADDDQKMKTASSRHSDISGGGGFTWESLKQKASDVLGEFQLSTPTRTGAGGAGGGGDQEVARGEENKNLGVLGTVSEKLTDIEAAVKQQREAAAHDAAAKSAHEETNFTSETRRATADQVADYTVR